MRKSNNPKGRPRHRSTLSEISSNGGDVHEFTTLATLGFNKDQIRRIYGFSNDTFYNKLLKQPIVQKLLEDGRNLRETIILLKQMELVCAGNVKMLIHLGKSELGQTYSRSTTGNNFKIKDFDYKITEQDLNLMAHYILNTSPKSTII